MIIKETYYIKRCGTYLWTGDSFEELPIDEIIEIRPMLFADEGKVLVKGDVEIGSAVWLRENDLQDYYTEMDEPIDEAVVEEFEEDGLIDS